MSPALMKSRWFHRPRLHSPNPGTEKKVGWLELFYDLIFVATIIQLGDGLAHHPTVTGFAAFAGVFVPIWLAWTSFTFFSNRFTVDDSAHRFMVFAQMFGVGAMAISVPQVLEGQTQAFALSYAFVRAVLAAMYFRAWAQVPEARELTKRWAWLFALDAGLWLTSAFVEQPWVYVLWAVGVGLESSIPFTRATRDLAGKYPADVLHMTERYGLLIIIVLGEGFVKVLSQLSGNPDALDGDTLAMASMALLITCSLWWIYFDDVAGSRIKAKRGAPFIWVYAHLPMTIGITGVGVALKKVVFDLDLGVAAPAKIRWLLCGTLALALLSVAIIDHVTERRESELSDRSRVAIRLFSAAFIMLLAPVGGLMDAGVFLALVTVAAVSQVVFDLMMAPLVDVSLGHHEAADPGVIHREVSFVGDNSLSAGLGTVRRGTPNALRRDLYFYFMEGGWLRVFVVMGFLYVSANALFACLYLLEPSSVSNLSDGDFLGAFAFSVQTMSTIGYGAMSPVSDYGHLLVTVQSGVGILAVALATGLMFAKASRPKSSTLFSKVAVVNRQDGQRVLSFRAGNARGNEIIDASMTCVVLRDVTTAEGDTMRRLYDLKLVRESTPLFVVSWTIMHVIDAESPLFGVDWSDPQSSFAGLICTMMGHDATYAQAVHARHYYRPEDLVVGQRFVDIITKDAEQRMVVDYGRFHDTRTEAPVDEV